MICPDCGGSGTVLRPRDWLGRERTLRSWFTWCSACWGTGVTAADEVHQSRQAPPFGKPYERVNQVDWYGTLWSGATFIYSGCSAWDSRDGFELIPTP